MTITVLQGDCLALLPTLADASVDAIVTDPPYWGVKDAEWDRRWSNAGDYLAWLDRVAEQWARVLKPNGSLYCFASPRMAGRVEHLLGGRFEVLTHIVWAKTENQGADGFKRRRDHGQLRAWLPFSERVIFAEKQVGGVSPLAAAITAARQRAGLKSTDIDVALGYVRRKDATRGTELCRRWEEGSSLPSADDYARALAACGDRREYEDLRREYEDLRRPFAVTCDDQYTDVWEFPTVHPYPGKHPCEKPAELLSHILRASTKPGAVVLDCFAGSGSLGIACRDLGRSAILIEEDPAWVERIHARLAMPSGRLPVADRRAPPGQADLLEAAG